MFEAEKIMKTSLITVKKDCPIYTAIRSLVDNNITGLPVVNDDMTLAGVITEKDVIKLLYDTPDKPETVQDYMTPNPTTFSTKDSLIDIAECFVNNNFRRVPITDNTGKLAGIISRKDIIEYILKLHHKD